MPSTTAPIIKPAKFLVFKEHVDLSSTNILVLQYVDNNIDTSIIPLITRP